MADRTGIEWTEATWNPVVGCSIVSPGCTNCYAMKMADRLEAMAPQADGVGNPHLLHYRGTTTRGQFLSKPPVWTGKLALAPEQVLLAPLRRRKPTVYFVNSMGDLFHEDVPDAWIDSVFAVMALAPQHTFQILTKRSARMRAYLSDPAARERTSQAMPAMAWRKAIAHVFITRAAANATSAAAASLPNWPLPNVWLGVSAEDQRRADERIPDLVATAAAIRFVSAEPLLGPIDFHSITCRQTGSCRTCPQCLGGIDWVIVGGESGPNARPMHPDWARSVRDQCADAGMAFFFKQWGEWAPSETARPPKGTLAVLCRDGQLLRGQAMATGRIDDAGAEIIAQFGKARAGRLLDGVTHDAMPEVRHD